MKRRFKKPNWYPELDIIATKRGWVYTKNHNEVLNAISNLAVKVEQENLLFGNPVLTWTDILPSSFTKSTFVRTDTSNYIWIDAEYPIANTAGQLFIDWGDGNKQIVQEVDFVAGDGYIYYEHTYDTNGEYIVQVYSTKVLTYIEISDVTKVLDWGNPANVRLLFPSSNLIEVPTTLHPSMTDLSDMFNGATIFNQNISGWNTSNVTAMARMFSKAAAFNQNISGWDTSHVTTMSMMFQGAAAFNQPIGLWNTINVTAMDQMFKDASAFNQSLDNWNVSKITNMTSMFANASSFNGIIGSWNVSNVTDMSFMFNNASAFNKPVSNWDVSNVTNMNGIFNGATTFNQPINNWNTSNVTNMIGVFALTNTFNQPINNWNTSKVTDMTGMFNFAEAFNQDLTQWCVPLILSEPLPFALNAAFSNANYPVWGTCPRGENLVI